MNGNYKTYKVVLPTSRITTEEDKYTTPEPTTTLGPEDSGNGTLTIQVIEDVDLVKTNM